MGSPRFRSLEVEGFGLTEAWFPPFLTLYPHVHERACFAVMLEGSFDLAFRSRSCACPPCSVVTEPAGERHSNRLERAGAHVMVVQPDPDRAELLRPCGEILDRVSHLHHPGIAALAWRLAEELRGQDSVSGLMMEGLILEMFASAARLGELARAERQAPVWLAHARDLLHDRFSEGIRLGEVAREVGVHPVHLARVFRGHFRVPIGAYVRRLRLDWAQDRLRRTDDTLADIALRAGFADQSHFTRQFKRHTGLTPDRYRRLTRSS